MGRFLPGARISQVHGSTAPVDPATGARAATVLAMYHPAAALRTPAIERESYQDIGGAPRALLDARVRREGKAATTATATAAVTGPEAVSPDDERAMIAAVADASPAPASTDLTIF
jgi:hypothetical protein